MRDFSQTIIDIKHNNRLSNKALANMLGVSMHSVQAWCTGRRKPSKVMLKHIEAIFDNKSSTEKEEKEVMNNQSSIPLEGKSNEQLLIELQQEKISNLNSKILMYEGLLKNPAEGVEFNSLKFDLRTEVEIKFSLSGVKRRMTKIDNGYKKIAGMLDLDPKRMLELYAPMQWYVMNEHPINKVIEESNLARLQHLTKTLPERFETLKTITGDHYVSEPIVYAHNDRKVFSWVHCKIHWGLQVMVDCKSQIIYD